MKIYVLWPSDEFEDSSPVMYAKTLNAGVNNLIESIGKYIDDEDAKQVELFLDQCESEKFRYLTMNNIHDLMNYHPEFNSNDYHWEEVDFITM